MKTISRDAISKMTLRGKPKCPFCHRPLTYVYEGSKGFSGEKCQQCKQEFLVNTETLEVFQISKAV